MKIEEFIGLKIVESPQNPTQITLQAIYDIAEKIHPLKESHPAMLRCIKPNENVTDDIRKNRLNLSLNNNDIIIDTWWG